MDKNEFLEKLKKNISVLEEREIEDIISEYEQHIDMRISKGLSEEEAIADFGDIDELCAQILEAYHVDLRHEAAAEPRGNIAEDDEPDYEKLKSESKKAAKKAARQAKAAAGESAQRIGEFVSSNSSRISGIIRKTLKRPENEKNTCNENNNSAETEENPLYGKDFRRPGSKGVLERANNFIRGIVRTCIHVIIWCARLAWNSVWIAAAFISGIFALISVFVLGVMVVLLVQGYPVVGIALMSLGASVSFCAFTILCTVFTVKMRWKRGEQPV